MCMAFKTAITPNCNFGEFEFWEVYVLLSSPKEAIEHPTEWTIDFPLTASESPALESTQSLHPPFNASKSFIIHKQIHFMIPSCCCLPFYIRSLKKKKKEANKWTIHNHMPHFLQFHAKSLGPFRLGQHSTKAINASCWSFIMLC